MSVSASGIEYDWYIPSSWSDIHVSHRASGLVGPATCKHECARRVMGIPRPKSPIEPDLGLDEFRSCNQGLLWYVRKHCPLLWYPA